MSGERLVKGGRQVMGRRSRGKRERRPGPSAFVAIVTAAAHVEARGTPGMDDPALLAQCPRCQAPLWLRVADGAMLAGFQQIARERLPGLPHPVASTLICGDCAQKAVRAWAAGISADDKPLAREWENSAFPAS